MANQVLQDQSDADWGRQSDVEETPAPGTPEAARYRPPHRRGSRTPPTPNMWHSVISRAFSSIAYVFESIASAALGNAETVER